MGALTRFLTLEGTSIKVAADICDHPVMKGDICLDEHGNLGEVFVIGILDSNKMHVFRGRNVKTGSLWATQRPWKIPESHLDLLRPPA